MYDDRRIADLELHIRAAVRPDLESVQLAERLVAGCWPGGSADRSEPVARGWLRMWGPVKVVATVPVCRCADGRCPVCN